MATRKPVKRTTTRTRKTPAEKPFDKLTAAQKRVTIAWDALEQLRLRKLTARQMAWVRFEKPMQASESNQEVCDLLKGQKCEACALGSLFVTAVLKADKLKVGDLVNISRWRYDAVSSLETDDVLDYLGQFFDGDQLELIESAFEGGHGWFENERSAGFLKGVRSPAQRMRLVLENVVANNGQFKPSKLPVRENGKLTTPGFKG